jgi:DNA-directed RNA polymerase subunit RPC12/RpoP
MSAGWLVVPRGEHDVEEVADARSALAECPSCGSRVRLTERELVRNLKVLGLALLATERAGRVYQCPRCDALCAREGDELPLGLAGAEVDDARVESLTDRVLKAEDESALWAQRAAVATSRGEVALADEMRAQSTRSARAAKVLRKELAALTGARADHSAAEDTAQGPAPTPALDEAAPALPAAASEPSAPPADTLEDELAALRAKGQSKRRPAPAEAAKADVGSGAVPVEDDLAALKAKLGRPAPAEDKPAEDKPAEDKPAEDKPAEDKPVPPSSDDDELAAMKRSLRKKD